MQRFRLCAFDNVCACIRRSVWETHPFVRTPIAEDVEWGRAALLAGRRLVYNPNAMVVHSHDRTVAYEFERTRRLHEQLHQLFGLQTIPTVRHLVRAVAGSLMLHVKLERGSPRVFRAPSDSRSPGPLASILVPALEPDVTHRSPWSRRHEGADRRARLSAPRAGGQ